MSPSLVPFKLVILCSSPPLKLTRQITVDLIGTRSPPLSPTTALPLQPLKSPLGLQGHTRVSVDITYPLALPPCREPGARKCGVKNGCLVPLWSGVGEVSATRSRKHYHQGLPPQAQEPQTSLCKAGWAGRTGEERGSIPSRKGGSSWPAVSLSLQTLTHTLTRTPPPQ